MRYIWLVAVLASCSVEVPQVEIRGEGSDSAVKELPWDSIEVDSAGLDLGEPEFE